jgi:hypothetical protein
LFQHAEAGGAIVLDRPGVYEGDTSASDDTVQVCPCRFPPRPGGDAGPPPSEEECVHSVEAEVGGAFTHECLHCACGIDSATVVACDATCRSLSECVVEGSLDDSSAQSCPADYDQCQSDGLGAATSGYTYSGGLLFIVIVGVDDAAGPYRMSVIH